VNGRDREKDMEALAEAFFDSLQKDDGYGSWTIDPKRPFGNSGILSDVLEIIDLGFKRCKYCHNPIDDSEDLAREYAKRLYDDLGPWLKAKWKQRKS